MMDTENLQPQLYSREAEESLIGAILINPSARAEINLDSSDFYVSRNRDIWAAITALDRAGSGIDIVTLTELLDRQGKLESAGGAAYMTGLITVTPSSFGAEQYARIVRDYAARRRLLQSASLAAKAAYDLATPVYDSVPGLVDSILNSTPTDAGAVHVSHFTRQLLDHVIDRMNNPGDLDGIPTGFIDFDKVSMGLQPGEVLLITGEPGTGKSITAMQAALQIAQKDYPVACYALEMRGEAVTRRWVSGMSKVQVSEMRRGIDPEKLQSITAEIDRLDSLPIYICDRPDISLGALRADLVRLQKRHGIQAFVLDYDYLVTDGHGMSENDRTILISALIKSICRDREIPGIVIHSMNKSGAGSALDKLRGSKQVAFDIDWLIVMRQSEENPIEIVCTIEKGRELETAKRLFSLIKQPGLPVVGNAARKPAVNLDALGYGSDRRDWQNR